MMCGFQGSSARVSMHGQAMPKTYLLQIMLGFSSHVEGGEGGSTDVIYTFMCSPHPCPPLPIIILPYLAPLHPMASHFSIFPMSLSSPYNYGLTIY